MSESKEQREPSDNAGPDSTGGFREYRHMIISSLERLEEKIDKTQKEVQEVNVSQAKTSTTLDSIETEVKNVRTSVEDKHREVTSKIAAHDTRIGAIEGVLTQAKVYSGLGSRVFSYIATIVIAILTAAGIAALSLKR